MPPTGGGFPPKARTAATTAGIGDAPDFRQGRRETLDFLSPAWYIPASAVHATPRMRDFKSRRDERLSGLILGNHLDDDKSKVRETFS